MTTATKKGFDVESNPNPIAGGAKGSWLWRIKLSEKQALLAFPKFGGEIWIGFETWKLWSKNYESSHKTRVIYKAIKQSKGDESIDGKTLFYAIKALQKTIKKAKA